MSDSDENPALPPPVQAPQGPEVQEAAPLPLDAAHEQPLPLDPNENVPNDFVDEEQALHSSDDNEEDESSEAEENPDAPPPFDQQLPMRHSYLGEGMEELQGRVVLEEDCVLELPLLAMNLHLIPGQILPMTVYHAAFQNALRRCILNQRLFGIVNSGTEQVGGGLSRGALGTMAEIYEFQEERDEPDAEQPDFGHSFAIKAKGRQRFNVLELRRQADGNLMAKVRVRPEVCLPSLWTELNLDATRRYHFPSTPSSGTPALPHAVVAVDEDSSRASEPAAKEEAGLEALVAENRLRRRAIRYYSVMTAWPAFVHENYDERLLVERIHGKLTQELDGLTGSGTAIPLDPSDLSFWLAQNLTMDDSIRLQILKLDSPIQRLRFELSLLNNVTRTISCRQCLSTVGDWAEAFSMSVEGPQGTYVNPNGYVHDTLTLRAVVSKELLSRGLPSTEASWFPGYAWTIVECRRCGQHLGWKFMATDRMKPKKFWGLARRSVTSKYNFVSDSTDSEPPT